MVTHPAAEHHRKVAEHHRKAAQHHDEAIRPYEVGSFVAAAAESGHALGQQAAVVLHTAQAARAHATHASTKK